MLWERWGGVTLHDLRCPRYLVIMLFSPHICIRQIRES